MKLDNVKVYVINGRGGKGKDTVCSILAAMCDSSDIYFESFDSARLTKKIAKECGWDNKKDDRGRKLLADIQTALIEYDDIPFKKTHAAVCRELSNMRNKNVFFIHAREPREITKYVDAFDAKTVLVVNDNVPDVTSNHADASVLEYKYDFIIENNGSITDLKQTVLDFFKKEVDIWGAIE